MPPAFQVQVEQSPFQGPSLGLFSSNKRTLIQDVVKFGNDKPPEVNHPRSLTTTADDHRPSHLIGSRPLTYNKPRDSGDVCV